MSSMREHNAPGAAETLLHDLAPINPRGDPIGRALEVLRQAEAEACADPERQLARLAELTPQADPVARAMKLLERETEAAADLDEAGLKTLAEIEVPRWVVARALWQLRGEASYGSREPGFRWGLRLATAGLCMTVAAAVVWQVTWTSSVPPPVQESATAPQLVVTSVTGGTTIERNGRVMSLQSGEALLAGDLVTTQTRSSLTITLGPSAQIRLDGLSTVRIDRVLDGVPVIDLRRGRVEGRAGRNRGSPNVRFLHRDQEVNLVEGSLGVLRSGRGRLAIASLGSDSILEIDGRRIMVPAGHQIRLGPESASAEPEALPLELVLELIQRQPLQRGERTLKLAGKTDPDVLLIINNQPVPVGGSGRFVATRRVRPRFQKIQAEVRDAAGRTRVVNLRIKRVSAQWKWAEPG